MANRTIKAKIREGVFPGNRVYVPTPEHGFVEAEVIKVSNKANKVKSVTLRYVDDFVKETYGDDDVVYMESNLQKVVPKGAETVRPLHWVQQNRKEFPEWVTRTFLRYNSCKPIRKKAKKGFQLFDYQAFIRDYLGHNSPYRGLLVFHGLGSGKTCSAVAVSENLKDTRNVVVMLPASLRNNFLNDGLKKCGDPLYKETSGNRMIKEKYSFISYNASNVIKQIENVGSLDNKVIIVDEVHNLATMITNGLRGMGRQGAEVYRRLLEAKNCKLTFLSGTPLVNTPFEIAVLFNILRGLIEVTMFAVRNFSEVTIDDYLAEVIKDDRIGYVDFNRRNRSMVAILKVQSWDMEFEQTVRYMEKKGKEHGAIVDFQKVDKYSLFPEDEDEFNSYFVKNDDFVNKTTFQRRILGLTSYFRGASEDNTDFPTLLPEKMVRVPMSPHQYEIYELAREEERKKERRAAISARDKQKKGATQVPTLARVFSREFSNFVFPDSILRPFKAIQFISASVQKEKDEAIKSKLAKGEITEEEAKRLMRPVLTQDQWERQLNAALSKVSDPDKPYLKPGKEGLMRYSPKMLAMLKEIEKSNKGLVLVYSAFRKVEGLEIFARILEANGYKRYLAGHKMVPKDDYKRFAFYSGQEDFKDRERIKRLFTSSENKEGKLIRMLLTSSAGTEGLDLKNIRKVLIMEPYWHEIRIRQVVGRAVRKNSHIDLPEKERNVQVYRYLSVLDPKQRQLSREKMSTDEYVLRVAKKKEALNQDVMQAVKEAAVDCTLNQCVNGMKGKCFKFAGSKEGLAYLPDLSRDIVFGYEQTKTRTIKRKVLLAGLTTDNEIVFKKSKGGPWYLGNGEKWSGKKRPKMVKGKRFAYDPESMQLFDYETLKRTGNLSVVGRVDSSGRVIPL